MIPAIADAIEFLTLIAEQLAQGKTKDAIKTAIRGAAVTASDEAMREELDQGARRE